MLENLCNNPQLLVDVFVNYDCDLESTNLFEHLVRPFTSKLTPGRKCTSNK
ncbi:hypothetical protein M758_3G004400 [Ceratodon purpureus]|uniref:Mon2/Sec7/BIG1-like HUS domain-containing protein n=1 Tax=Ceratodon purpureus TaxID=3225 RepID=A0A8T0IGU3_CERPU|nr:hypothetical protein KC19_3G006500 [Ceratodon purpureus]KAG0621247.1 hypothetical protein M758_3G004400 [Ceratodon purpureus]